MKRIDRETVQKIIDTADIVEVVSDFVNLKKRGANYIGLCPFHNERTPSFSVSKSKGICKCFSCGKGGSPVNFIMEHEQMSYYEALRYLARKYNIEIKEHELTDEERQQATLRESMMAVNDFALKHFRHNLTDTDDGRDIGLSYFRERGINDAMIERFALGYALDRSDDLYNAAKKAGFEEQYLIDTGLCSRNDRGRVYDRFRGRVIYPVFSVSGRVVAFGGRILSSDKSKTIAKYVNSPESAIYRKSYELYGLYQAKQAIVKSGKCILVEGYMDVISMHQAGVENVVASSGTSLTEGQIRLIHRFTENVTVIYDADPAGIKASLRGIDMLLAEGMNIKVMLLPEGEDPDSFAQSHSSAEVEQYIADHETDFISFKTNILLSDAKGDPIARARVINDIIRSISVIPDAVVRSEYIKLCSRMLEVDEKVLVLQLQKFMADAADAAARRSSYRKTDDTPAGNSGTPAGNTAANPPATMPDATVDTPPAHRPPVEAPLMTSELIDCETQLLKYIVKYGMTALPVEDGEEPITVLEYIWCELDSDGITFTHPVYLKIFNMAIDLSRNQWPHDSAAAMESLKAKVERDRLDGIEKIRQEAADLADIEAREKVLNSQCEQSLTSGMRQFATGYLENIFISHPDDDVRNTATDLATEKYVLSKVHTHYSHVPTEEERLIELVPRATASLKLAIINLQIDDNFKRIKDNADTDSIVELLQRQKELFAYRTALSKFLGERIVTPPRKR